ncbi:MAG: aromatic ring-hydroxylating dioxygenase subunit alpha [Alphaproteobacteria bacterium]|nr:aromatic ring-hydroxylating dioxygenase subunit alpha [Alphaproteobacteria bacterium]
MTANSTCDSSQDTPDPTVSPRLRGLAPAAYVDPAFFAQECRELFPKAWTFVGFAHEISTHGDALPVTVGGQPILLVNRGDNEIVAFHNVCRHRAAVLIDTPSNAGRFIRCPYHCWTYDLDGKLCRAPHFGGPNVDFPDGFLPEDHGLKPVRCTVWHDWIFVNINGNAPDFDVHSAALRARLSDIDLESLRPIGVIDLGEVRTNWKFLMENFIEPYHVQFVHTSTTRQPLVNHSTFVDGNCIGSAVDIDPKSAATEAGVARLEVSSRYLTLFPNFVLGWYEPDQLGVHLNVPVAPGITRQRRALYQTGSAAMSDSQIDDLKQLWCKVHREDHEICERLQMGRASPVAADGGVLSPHWEVNVRRFQDLVLEAASPVGDDGAACSTNPTI